MSIATEGYELHVLEGMDWECHRPKILLCGSLGEKDLIPTSAEKNVGITDVIAWFESRLR